MLQAKKTFWGKRPGLDSGDLLHIGVNLGFSIVLGAMVLFWQLTPLAIALVILSKWRTFAVQPRFWIPNIKANLVDVIVGVSCVGLMHQSQESMAAYLWVAVYAVWLLFIKPRSSDFWVSTQALWAQTLGLIMIFGSTDLVTHAVVVCLLAWVISWSAARHYFSNYDEPHYRALSLLWGFLIMQVVWYALHWLQYYFIGGLMIAAAALFVTVISATVGSMYHAHKNDAVTRNLIIENVLLSTIVLLALVVTSGWKPIL
ncbi:hypothetical protein KBD20_00330 [Candidatus Saccharibacteria bacterium]|nr:hypothetical protein [Candidatus Saccharibacteria bacterium]